MGADPRGRRSRRTCLGSVYVNELQEEGADCVRDAYGPAFSRLAAIKRQDHPDNIFRLNQNIPPA